MFSRQLVLDSGRRAGLLEAVRGAGRERTVRPAEAAMMRRMVGCREGFERGMEEGSEIGTACAVVGEGLVRSRV